MNNNTHPKKKLLQIIFACCLILCVSCEKEGLSPLEQIQAGAPVVTDQAASVTEISVVLSGYVNPQYLMMGGECGFIISTSPSPSLNNGKKFSSNEIDLNGRYSVALTNLSSSTKYYFKSYVTSGTSYLEGEAKGFTTKSVRARVTTMSASDVSLVSATLNGSLAVEGEEELPKSVSFLFSTSEKTLESLKSNGERKYASLEDNGSFSRTIESLSLNTTYYYVACAEVHDKEFYGEVKSFTTTNIGVTLTTNAATEIGLFEATLNGNLVVKNDEQLSKTVWFLYSDSAKTLEDLKSSGKRVSSYLSEDGSFTKALSSLDDNTTYYYVACAKVHDSEYYGVVKSFTTTNIGVTLTTNVATDIELFEATLNGNLIVENGEQLSKTVWFLYSDSARTLEDLKSSGKRVSSTLSDDGMFTKSLTSLKYNTTYYYVACARVHNKEFYGEARSFTTTNVTVTTNSATEIGFFGATLNGNLLVENGEQLTKSVWFLYSDSARTADNLRTSGNKVSSTLSDNGSFTNILSSLKDNTTYYYIACAKVDNESFYGEVRSFTTTNVGVSVTTNDATDIGLFEATLNGNLVVRSDEQFSKTVWFLYSKTAKTLKELIASGSRVSSSLEASGSFSNALGSLTRNTTYYYVACAKVHDTEYYGAIRSFTTSKYNYASVDLGLSVKWAECNLGAIKPEEYGGYYQWAGTRDVSGRSIYLNLSNCPYHSGSSSSSGWKKYNTISSYGTVDNITTLESSDDAATVNYGGKWRMPTNAEWQELIDNCTWTWTTLNGINGYMVTSKKNGNSIFLPAAGIRYIDRLADDGYNGGYWSSSLESSYPFCAYYVGFKSGSVGRNSDGRWNGRSVRPVTE